MTVKNAAIADAEERALVLDPKGSFAVSAPAGSGKTELLTQRVLTLLAYVEKPEEILAITFTRKAAKEMQDRIVQALLIARNEPAPEEAHRLTTWNLARNALVQNDRHNWSLLENPHRLAIKTIDSLCMQFTQRLPLLTGLGTDAAIDEQPNKLYELAIRRLLVHIESKDEISHDLQLLLRHLDNNTARVEALLTTILAKRDQWLRHIAGSHYDLSQFKEYLEHCLLALVNETLSKSSVQFNRFSHELMGSLQFAAVNLAQEKSDSAIVACRNLQQLPGTQSEDLNQWIGIVELLTTKTGGWRARLTKGEGFPTAPKGADKDTFKLAKANCLELIGTLSEHPELLDTLAELKALPSPTYNQDQWQLLGALTRLLPNLVAELLVIFSEKGTVDYPQITGAANAALGSQDAPSDLALLLDYKIKHILIDEFQDTSSSQFALLERLTEGWQFGDEHSLFIVGDGMQSCYGFRDANVGLFLAARETGIGNALLEPVDLKVNFRSRRGVVDWVNKTFQHAFPPQNDISRGAVSYSPSIAHSTDTDLKDAVSIYLCVEDEQRSQEAKKVAELIKNLHAESVQDDIAILVRNRSHLREIIPALQKENIAWQAVDIDPLVQRPVISDLFALTRAVLNLADQIAWLAVLRAPWCGLSLDDLHTLTGNSYTSKHSCVWTALHDADLLAKVSSHGQQALLRLKAVLEPALGFKQRKPLRQWLEGIWLALGGPATTQLEEFPHAESFFELLDDHDTGSTIKDFQAFTEAAERLYARPTPNPDIKVQIMTIHKAKGLEFDHVIVPGLDRASPADQHALLLWHERLTEQGLPQLLISPVAAKGAEEDPLYRYLKGEHSIKQKLENTRLMYVAATRAIKNLYLLACVKQNDKTGELKTPGKSSLLHSIWESVQTQAELIEAVSIEADEAPNINSLLTRFSADWQLPELPTEALLKDYRGHEYQEANPNDLFQPIDLEQDDPKQLKTVFLALLEQKIASDIKKIDPSHINSVLKNLTNNCVNTETLAVHIKEAFDKTCDDKNGQWLLNLEATSKIEARVFSQSTRMCGPQTIHSICVPLAFLDNDEYWLIDFNLELSDHEAFEQQKQTILAPYKDQMGTWARAYSTLQTHPVKAAVYFPFLQHLEHIDF